MRKLALTIAAVLILAILVLGGKTLLNPKALPTIRPEADAKLDEPTRQAIEKALALVDEHPANPEARLRLGLTYDANGLDRLAQQTYEQTLQLDDRLAKCWYWLGLCRAETDDIEGAMAAVTEALDRDPTYLPAIRQLGLWHLQEGRVDEARRQFETALEKNPEDPSTLVSLARTDLQSGDPAAAAEKLEHALRITSQYNYARLLLGNAYRNLGRIEEAQHELSLAQGSEPIYEDPWSEEVLVYRAGYSGEILEVDRMLRRGEARQAIVKLQNLRRNYPEDVVVLNKLAEAYRLTGRSDEARRLLELARERHPEHVLTRLKLSSIYEVSGDLDLAIAEVREAIRLSPEYGTAYRQLGRLLAMTRDLPGATEALEQAIQYGRDEPDIMQMLGEIDISLGRWDAAIDIFEKLRAAVPGSPDAHLWLSLAYAETNRLDLALPMFQRARELNPRHPQYERVKARIRTLYEAAGGGRMGDRP